MSNCALPRPACSRLAPPLKPTVTLSAQAGFSGDRLLDFREDSFGTNATAAARWQLVDGGARDAGVDAAMASVEAADSLVD